MYYIKSDHCCQHLVLSLTLFVTFCVCFNTNSIVMAHYQQAPSSLPSSTSYPLMRDQSLGIAKDANPVIGAPKVISFLGASGRAIPIINSNVTLYPSLPKRFRATTSTFLSDVTHFQQQHLPSSWVQSQQQQQLGMSSFIQQAPQYQYPPTTMSCNAFGLADLHMSGSAQFSVAEFESMASWLSSSASQPSLLGASSYPQHPIDNIWIVDLRQEPHGFINDQTAFSWFSSRDWATYGLDSVPAIDQLQRRLLKSVADQENIMLYNIMMDANDEHVQSEQGVPVRVQRVQDEGGMVVSKRPAFRYIHIPTLDHMTPSARAVAQLENLVRQVQLMPVEQRPWIHFHCAQGEGRTTTFMVMMDCMINGPRGVSFDDILRRQFVLGGIDLSKAPDNWKKPYYVERLEFLRQFYQKYAPQHHQQSMPQTIGVTNSGDATAISSQQGGSLAAILPPSTPPVHNSYQSSSTQQGSVLPATATHAADGGVIPNSYKVFY